MNERMEEEKSCAKNKNIHEILNKRFDKIEQLISLYFMKHKKDIEEKQNELNYTSQSESGFILERPV